MQLGEIFVRLFSSCFFFFFFFFFSTSINEKRINRSMADYMEIGTLRCTSDLDTQAGFYGFRDFSLSNVDVTGDAPFFPRILMEKKKKRRRRKEKNRSRCIVSMEKKTFNPILRFVTCTSLLCSSSLLSYVKIALLFLRRKRFLQRGFYKEKFYKERGCFSVKLVTGIRKRMRNDFRHVACGT